jgi:hypothetical protein
MWHASVPLTGFVTVGEGWASHRVRHSWQRMGLSQGSSQLAKDGPFAGYHDIIISEGPFASDGCL